MYCLIATKKYGGHVAWDTNGKQRYAIEIEETVALFVQKKGVREEIKITI